MDTLNGTTWDVVIAGTGLQPALLALALSRSGKKVLHLDSHDYYGGAEAALSLLEIETWAKNPEKSRFGRVILDKPDVLPDGPKLALPRAYSLSLSPCLLYTRSALLPALVSSKAHEQLEFLAVGSWFVYTQDASFMRVPNSREDIFSDTTLSLRTKSALVKFLRFVAFYQEDDKREIWEPYRDAPFADLLATQFKIQPELQGPLLALTMSVQPSSQIKTEAALQSIQRHLTSMGVFGAGFSAVLPKYGGLSEVVQVACRAAAVGGTVYVLNREIQSIETTEGELLTAALACDESVQTRHLFATNDQLPVEAAESTAHEDTVCSKGAYIVGSKLLSLFPPPSSGSPPPSAAVVVVPSSSLAATTGEMNQYPIHMLVHSSDTGECPSGQCVLYATSMQRLSEAAPFLDLAVEKLLSSNHEDAQVLWKLKYEVYSTASSPAVSRNSHHRNVYHFAEGPAIPVFDDRVLGSVNEAWKLVNEGEEGEFLKFGDRNAEGAVDVDDDEDEGLL